MSIERITLCGGGNGVHALAPIALAKGREVNIWAPFEDEAERLSTRARSSGGIEAIFDHQRIKRMPHTISKRAEDVIPEADVIVMITPAFAHQKMLNEIEPSIKKKATIVVMPTRSGLEYQYHLYSFRERQIHLLGFQSLPWACRIEEYGERVRIFGVKKSQSVAVLGEGFDEGFLEELGEMIGMDLSLMEGFLSLTLGNVGQLIHPGIMYGIIKKYAHREFFYDEIPLFYQGVDASTAKLLEAMSSEILMIRDSILQKSSGEFTLNDVISLEEWLHRSYGESILDPGSLESSFTTNKVYQGLKAPVVEKREGVYVLDKNTRYLREDVPFGLLVSKGIGVLCGLETPVIDKVILAVQEFLGKEYLKNGYIQGKDIGESRIPQNYGIHTLESLLESSICSI